MKEFIIPVEWSMCSFLKVKADTINEAIGKARDAASEISIPQQVNEQYIDGSFAVCGTDTDEDAVSMCTYYTKEYEAGRITNFDILEEVTD